MDPHQNQPVQWAGKPLEEASAALVLLHGRGASAADILTLADELYHPEVAYVAPQAAGGSWYPYSFLAPIPDNEPGISSGIEAISTLVDQMTASGLPYDRLLIGGFSQGACLALEYVARNAQRFGGVIGYSGGLIGPDGSSRDYSGSLDGTPIFLGCSDIDFHIPKERVELTAEVLDKMQGAVTMRLYPGMGHTINQDELDQGRSLVTAVAEK
jgi:predicted esterase